MFDPDDGVEIGVITHRAGLRPGDGADHGQFAIHTKLRRVEKAPDAGHESALALAPGARCADGVQGPGQHLDLGVVRVIADGDDGPAPAHRLPGEARRVALDLGQVHRDGGRGADGRGNLRGAAAQRQHGQDDRGACR